jgi:putative transposase
MSKLAELIEETKDARELKRALSVKMGQSGMAVAQVGELLQVTPQYVRKWQRRYEAEGVEALGVGYRGSESYLSGEQHQEVAEWIGTHEAVSVEEVRDYIEEQYGVVYRSKQSYYEFLTAGGMSYHRTEPGNPKHDDGEVLERREEIKKNWRRDGRKLSGASWLCSSKTNVTCCGGMSVGGLGANAIRPLSCR